MEAITSFGQPQFLNDLDLSGTWSLNNWNTIPDSIIERWERNVVDRHVDIYGAVPVAQTVAGVAVGHRGQFTNRTGDPPIGISTMLVPNEQETSSTPNSHMVEMGGTTEPTNAIDVSKRTVKDGNDKVGIYTGKCQIETNISNGQPVYVPTGQGRMDYANNTVYNGEWEDGCRHGDGTLSTGSDGEMYEGQWMKGKRDGLGCQTYSVGNKYVGDWKDDVQNGDGVFTHHSGWTVEGKWERDRCIECSSINGLTVANYESAYEWAQQQDAAVVIPPLTEAMEGLGVSLSRFLREACSKGWTAAIRFLRDACSKGWTAIVQCLQYVLWIGLTIVAQILVDKGVSGNTHDKRDQAALHVAIKEGNIPTVKLLLEKDAVVDKRHKDGFAALDLAISNGKFDIAKELCKKMNIYTGWLGGSALSLHWAAYLGRVNVVRELIDKGGDIEVKEEDGRTPLHRASLNGHLDVVKVLVDSESDVEARDKDGWTPLHMASWKGHLDVVKFLIDNKVNIHAKGEDGWTPLHFASSTGHIRVVKFLVDNKADIDAKNKKGKTPLNVSQLFGHPNIVKYLQSKGRVEQDLSNTKRTFLARFRRPFR